MRYFYISLALAWLVWSPAGTASAQVRVPGRSATRQPAETVKIGQLQRGAQANKALYMIKDQVSGGHVLVRPGPGLELESYLDQDVVLHGKFQAAPDGRRETFVVERVVPMDEPAESPSNAASAKPKARPVKFQRDAFADPFSDQRVARQPSPEAIDLPPSDAATVEIMPDQGGEFMYPGPGPMYDGGPAYGAPLGPGYSETYWIRGEYLLWALDGMRLPPLVTTSATGTARAQAGVLGEPNTSVLYGDDKVNDDEASGFRIRAGFWMNPARSVGLEGEYFQLGDQTDEFTASSLGSPILARPFFDADQSRETAELIAFPNVIRGTVEADATTEVQGAGGRFRFNLCCGETGCCETGACGLCGGGGSAYRVDWLAGYRFMRLEDSVIIQEDLVSLETANPGAFLIRDEFYTKNEFHGGDLGAIYETRRGPWSLEMLTKVALGQNRQQVRIAGSTRITESGTTTAYPGGLLAQRTNIGVYEREEFAVIPEIGFTLGYQIRPSWKLLVGYSMVYFSNVVRAGDQIDLDVNPNLLPPEAVPFSGPLRPEFAFDETDFWMHGLNVGLELRR